ncbi:MAG: futalosine hydrolase [Haliscomenobacter sp.]|nr:futalosine hydrolase [Haliscomenobacter sp.]MBK8877567.1 futalosine hydrolase [Haliscomenobacter sp.]
MRILIVAATGFELLPFTRFLEEKFVRSGEYTFQKGAVQVSVLITGVGITMTTYALARLFPFQRFDLAINAGIAGAFHREPSLGDVVEVSADTMGDLGVEERDGRFASVFSLGLCDPNLAPFTDGWLHNPDREGLAFLPKVSGITVHKVHGSEERIREVRELYHADVETMESAAFFYVCLQEKIPFLAIRSISNYVEPRNREAWNISLAIENLNQVLIGIIQGFSGGIKEEKEPG